MSCLRLIELRTLLTSSRLLLLLINAQVVSKLFYCSTVWSNTPRTNLSKLQAVQNFACRIVRGKGKFDHMTPTLKELHWSYSATWIWCHNGSQVHDGTCPWIPSAQFIRWCDVTASRTRNSQVLLFLEQLAVKDLFIIEQSHYGILYQTILNVANHDQWAILNVALS